MTQNIPPGYQLHITSWENDADAYKTEIFSGLTDHDTSFLIEIATLFVSCHSGRKTGRRQYGSGAQLTWTQLADDIDEILSRHPSISDKLRESWSIDRSEKYWSDSLNEMVTTLVSYPGEGFDDYNKPKGSVGYIRVFDSYKVFFFPSEVKDVTDMF